MPTLVTPLGDTTQEMLNFQNDFIKQNVNQEEMEMARPHTVPDYLPTGVIQKYSISPRLAKVRPLNPSFSGSPSSRAGTYSYTF